METGCNLGDSVNSIYPTIDRMHPEKGIEAKRKN